MGKVANWGLIRTNTIMMKKIGGWGGESFRDPNREIDFGFVFVHVSCVRAKLCAMIPLWLGAAKLFSSPAPAAVGGRTSRDVPSIKIINVTFFIRKKSEQKRPVFPVKNFVAPSPKSNMKKVTFMIFIDHSRKVI